MTPAELLTLAGATAVVTILTEVTKRAAAFNDATASRFGPLLAIVYGVVIVVAVAVGTGADPLAGAVTGLFAGASASGVYSYAKATRAA